MKWAIAVLTMILGAFSVVVAQEPAPVGGEADAEAIVLSIDGFDWAATIEFGHFARDGTANYLRPAVADHWGFARYAEAAPWSGDVDETDFWVGMTADLIVSLAQQAKVLDQPFVIAAHSWGSVLAYRALGEAIKEGRLLDGDVDLFVTMGSPIGERRIAASANVAGLTWDAAKAAVITRAVTKHLNWKGAGILDGPVVEWRNYWIKEDYVSGPIDGLGNNIALEIVPTVDCSPHSAYYKPCADQRDAPLVSRIAADVLSSITANQDAGAQAAAETDVETGPTAEQSPEADAPTETNDVHGVWANGDCRMANEARIVGRHSILDILYDVATRSYVAQFFTVEDSDGGLSFSAAHPAFKRPVPINMVVRDDLLNGQYRRCENMPYAYALAFGEAFTFLRSLDDVIDACSNNSARECLSGGLSVFDVSGDGVLKKAELVRMLRAVSFIVTYYSSEDVRVPIDVLSGGLFAAAAVGPAVVQVLIDGSDYNGDGGLDIDELLVDRPGDGIVDAIGVLRVGAIQGSAQALMTVLGEVLGGMFSQALTGGFR